MSYLQKISQCLSEEDDDKQRVVAKKQVSLSTLMSDRYKVSYFMECRQ